MSTGNVGDSECSPLQLSPKDQRHLTCFTSKMQVVRDLTVGVDERYYTGFSVTGRGGTSKSWTIVDELERREARYTLTNGHLSDRDFFDRLAERPDDIHLVEDVEILTRRPVALSILRAALWGSRYDRNGRMQRLIRWGIHGSSCEIVFMGGIILLANRKLGDLPEAKALSTRIPCVDIPVSDREIAALMRHTALQGYRRGELLLGPQEAWEVANYVIEESVRLNRALDMRVLIHGFAFRLQAEDHNAGCSWQDLAYSLLCGRPLVESDIEPRGVREQRLAQELETAREIVDLPAQERLRVWQEQTGLSQATLYRRLAELARLDSVRFEE